MKALKFFVCLLIVLAVIAVAIEVFWGWRFVPPAHAQAGPERNYTQYLPDVQNGITVTWSCLVNNKTVSPCPPGRYSIIDFYFQVANPQNRHASVYPIPVTTNPLEGFPPYVTYHPDCAWDGMGNLLCYTMVSFYVFADITGWDVKITDIDGTVHHTYIGCANSNPFSCPVTGHWTLGAIDPPNRPPYP